MPTMRGPCAICGRDIEKYVRPGKQLLCLACAIQKSADHNRYKHEHPGLDDPEVRARAADQVTQYLNREGEWYERWRGGMANYLASLSDTKDTE